MYVEVQKAKIVKVFFCTKNNDLGDVVYQIQAATAKTAKYELNETDIEAEPLLTCGKGV